MLHLWVYFFFLFFQTFCFLFLLFLIFFLLEHFRYWNQPLHSILQLLNNLNFSNELNLFHLKIHIFPYLLFVLMRLLHS